MVTAKQWQRNMRNKDVIVCASDLMTGAMNALIDMKFSVRCAADGTT